MRVVAFALVLFVLSVSDASAQATDAVSVLPPESAIPAGFRYLSMESSLCCEGMAVQRSYGRGIERVKLQAVALPTAADALTRCEEIVSRHGVYEMAPVEGYGERAWRGGRVGYRLTYDVLYFQQGGVCAGVTLEVESLDDRAATFEAMVRLMEARARGE